MLRNLLFCRRKHSLSCGAFRARARLPCLSPPAPLPPRHRALHDDCCRCLPGYALRPRLQPTCSPARSASLAWHSCVTIAGTCLWRARYGGKKHRHSGHASGLHYAPDQASDAFLKTHCKPAVRTGDIGRRIYNICLPFSVLYRYRRRTTTASRVAGVTCGAAASLEG